MIPRAYALLVKIAKAKKRKSKAKAKITCEDMSEAEAEDATDSQILQTSVLELENDRVAKELNLNIKELNSRAVKFSMSHTCVIYFDAEISQHSLVWYKSADLKQFKEDRIIDASIIKNRERERAKDAEKICWWGLERLIVPSVGSKTRQVRKQVKQVVLCKQDKAHQDRQLKEASEWAAAAAQEKATYYSSHLEL